MAAMLSRNNTVFGYLLRCWVMPGYYGCIRDIRGLYYVLVGLLGLVRLFGSYQTVWFCSGQSCVVLDCLLFVMLNCWL